MRADRLLSALLLLQAHGRLTSRQLANRLEVSERTMHRDMEALSAAGVPVFALRGSRGGWELDEGWRTQVPGLDEAELRAFLMAQPQVVGDQRLVHAAERALSKLMAAMPVSLREKAASIRQRLHVDTTRWYGTVENLSMLPIVQDAVSRDRKLNIVYKREGQSAERIVDPLGLVAKGTVWYLVAHTPRGFRTYRVSRIEQAKLLDRACERPPDFDLAAYWSASTAQFRERTRYSTTLRLAPKTAEMVQGWGCFSKLQHTDLSNDIDGWITMRGQFEDEDHACFVVLGLGPNADVLEPTTLRDRVAADIDRMLQRRS